MKKAATNAPSPLNNVTTTDKPALVKAISTPENICSNEGTPTKIGMDNEDLVDKLNE